MKEREGGEPSAVRKAAGTVLEVGGVIEVAVGAVKLSLPLVAMGAVVWLIGRWVGNSGKEGK